MQAGDLYKAIRKDKEGALLWNKKCALACRHGVSRVMHWADDLGAVVSGERRLMCEHACRAGGAGMGRAIALDIARGLTFLHSNNIAHMDLKTPNGAVLTDE